MWATFQHINAGGLELGILYERVSRLRGAGILLEANGMGPEEKPTLYYGVTKKSRMSALCRCIKE